MIFVCHGIPRIHSDVCRQAYLHLSLDEPTGPLDSHCHVIEMIPAAATSPDTIAEVTFGSACEMQFRNSFGLFQAQGELIPDDEVQHFFRPIAERNTNLRDGV